MTDPRFRSLIERYGYPREIPDLSKPDPFEGEDSITPDDIEALLGNYGLQLRGEVMVIANEHLELDDLELVSLRGSHAISLDNPEDSDEIGQRFERELGLYQRAWELGSPRALHLQDERWLELDEELGPLRSLDGNLLSVKGVSRIPVTRLRITPRRERKPSAIFRWNRSKGWLRSRK